MAAAITIAASRLVTAVVPGPVVRGSVNAATRRTGTEMPQIFRMKAPTRRDAAITKKAFMATRRASDRLVATEACSVKLRNTRAVPGD